MVLKDYVFSLLVNTGETNETYENKTKLKQTKQNDVPRLGSVGGRCGFLLKG